MWLDKQVSLYTSPIDNIGQAATFRQILFSQSDKDLQAIKNIRQLEKKHEDKQVNDLEYRKRKVELKSSLKCFSPASLLKSKASGKIIELKRSGVMQLDFDYPNIREYDIDELKACIFKLPFIGYCGLSCSGKGFYALALIAEPEKLREYAEHCFQILLTYGIKADTSKGRNITDLRFQSHDKTALIRENPTMLKILRFKANTTTKAYSPGICTKKEISGDNAILKKGIAALQNVLVGSRWETVQRVSFTLGGLGDDSIIGLIMQAIENNESFYGEEKKYLKCAKNCFNAGLKSPLQESAQEDFTCHEN